MQSITKKEYDLAAQFFVKIHKGFKLNISRKIKCNLLKFFFAWDFHNEIMHRILVQKNKIV